MLESLLGNTKDVKALIKGYNVTDLILCVLKQGLIFNKNEIKNIKNFYDTMILNKSKNLELEFRILRKGSNQPTIDKSTFEYILEFLLKSFPVEITNTVDTSVQKQTGALPKFRSTYSTMQDLVSGNSIKNEAKKTLLRPYFSDVSKLFNLQFKLNLSEELPTSKVIGLSEEGVNNNIRIKKRYSFNIGGLWRIDATIVKSGYSIPDVESKNETYELECEYIGGMTISFQNFLKSFSNLYILILQNTDYC